MNVPASKEKCKLSGNSAVYWFQLGPLHYLFLCRFQCNPSVTPEKLAFGACVGEVRRELVGVTAF